MEDGTVREDARSLKSINVERVWETTQREAALAGNCGCRLRRLRMPKCAIPLDNEQRQWRQKSLNSVHTSEGLRKHKKRHGRWFLALISITVGRQDLNYYGMK